MGFKDIKLLRKFVIIIILPTLLIFGGMFYLYLSQFNQKVTNNVYTFNAEKVQSSMLKVNEYMTEAWQVSKTLCGSPLLRNQNEALLGDYYVDLVKNNSNLYDVFSAYTTGNLTWAHHIGSEVVLESFDNSSFLGLGYEWFEGPMTSKEYYVTKAYIDVGFTEKLMFAVTAPIFNYNGEIIGMVGSDILLTMLQNEVENIAGQLGYEAFVIEKALSSTDQNNIIAHKEDKYLGQPLVNFTDTVGGTNLYSELKTYDADTTVNKNVTYGSFLENGQMKFYYALEFKNMPWIFVITIDEATALSDVQQSTRLIVIEFTVLAVLFILGVSYLTRVIVNPIRKLDEQAQKISKGNLTLSIETDRKDEIGSLSKSIATMMTEINNKFKKNQELSEQLSSTAEELSSTSEEISSSSENIASSQQQISKGASEQVSTISDTQKKFNDLVVGVKSIREKANSITQISESIRNISNQTNMLALNAAIEAARAGDAGRGFNVVADQVRKLAEESRISVANTDTLVAEISSITQQLDVSTSAMIKSIDMIATVAEETSASTEESAAAAEEQASSMESITTTAQRLLSLAEMLNKELKDYSHEQIDIPQVNPQKSESDITPKNLSDEEKKSNNFTEKDQKKESIKTE